MTRRAVALLLSGPAATGACPPGIAPAAFARALAEDLADLLSDLPGLDPVVAAAPERVADAEDVVWPGTAVLELPPTGDPVGAALAALAGRGYDEGAVLAPDAPDLPGLLVAKPFSALTTASAAAVPAEGGGLVLLAARLPAPDWLPAGLSLDTPYAVEILRAAARRELAVTPGWHRLRVRADLAALDPGLEGWETTRSLLSGS